MKHIGKTLKNHIENNHLKKRDVAEAVGITYNYLSTIFTKQSIDCMLLEKLCLAVGISPMAFFDVPTEQNKLSDAHNAAAGCSASASISSETKAIVDLLAEKERLIQVLMAASGINVGTKSEQESSN